MKRPFNAAGALVLAAFLVLGACSSSGSSSKSSSSSSSSSAKGDKAAFCAANQKIDDIGSTASTPADALKALKDNQSVISEFSSNAPDDIKSDADKLVAAASSALDKSDISPITDPSVQSTGAKVDSYCGVKSSSSSSAAGSSQSAAGNLPAACSLFNLNALNSATNLTWSIADGSKSDSCVITATNGNTVSIGLVPTAGQNDQALTGAESGCDAGTVNKVDVVDGGYTCVVSGVASAGALYKADNVLVAISAVTFNGASTEQVQQSLLAVLNSFSSTPTSS